ncbi:hypothetical protein CPB86DRAFT_387038 [Serendipita vermifera]|nr:hypothetical protein CPB86DRAFT_387038 [Serendipita vermifera]
MASTRALFNPLKTRQYALEHAFSIRSSMQNVSRAPYRALATSSTVHAKKKKTKTAQENDLFDEGNDEDDLFGGSSNSTSDKTRSPAPSSQASTFQSHERGTYASTEDQEKLRLQEIERSERFNALFDWLQKSTGPLRKGSGVQPGQTALVQLIRAAKTPNDFESVFNILRQWRLYPAATYREVVEHTLIERAIATGNTAILLPVLSHHPIYGISVPTASKARALLKSIISPPSATTEGVHHARLQQALDLAQVLAGTRVAVPVRTLRNSTQSPLTIVDQRIDSTSLRSDFVSLSPFRDFVSGSILLAALVRALTELPSSTQYSTEDCWKAVTELVNSLRSAQRDNKLLFSSIQQEQVWSLAALRQVKQDILSNKEALVTLSETQSASEPSISFEELVSWTDDSLGTVGAILVARGKTGAKIIAGVGSHMLETRSLGTEQAEL